MNIQGSVNSAIGSVARAKFAIEAFNTAKANEAAKRAERERRAKAMQTAKARKAKAAKRERVVNSLYAAGLSSKGTPEHFKNAMKQYGYRVGKDD